MSEALKRLEGDVVAAMKAGDRNRLTVLRMFVNKVKLAAKDDRKSPNRAVTDEDVISAGLKTVKEVKETRAILVERGVDISAQDAELAIISEYLPRQMDESDLRELLTGLSANAPEGKAARGFYNKELNANYRGQFDNELAQKIIAEMVG